MQSEHPPGPPQAVEPYIIDRSYAEGLVALGPFGVQAAVDALKAGKLSEEQARLVIEAVYTDYGELVSSVWPKPSSAEKERRLNPALELLRQPGGRARQSVAEALFTINAPSARLELIRLLNDPDTEIPDCAVTGLAKIGDPHAILPLVDRIRMAGRDVAYEVHKLGGLGHAAAGPIIRALPGSTPDGRKGLLMALADT